DGDRKKPIDFLRGKGMAKAAKKAARIAAEGSTHTEVSGNKAALIDVNWETDFVTKNEKSQDLLQTISNHIIQAEHKTCDAALQQTIEGENTSVEDYIKSFIATIGEKISFRRFTLLTKTDNDAFGAYTHMRGSIGVLALLEGTTDETVAKDIAMHAAAVSPRYVSRDEVPKEEVDREREVLKTQALNEGKPEKIVEKMVEGRSEEHTSELQSRFD